VRFEQNDSLEASDPHGLLFGSDEAYDERAYDEPTRYATGPSRRESSRRSRERERRRRRRRRMASLLALLVVVVVAATGWFVVRPLVEDKLSAKDWSGSGSGSVLVQVKPNDTSGDIAATLVKNGVVASKRAFTDAADNNKDALSIQPGYYRVHKHMAASLALAMLLQPSARVSTDVTIPEGLIEQDVLARLAKALNVPLPQVQKAAADIGNLGLPEGYNTASGPPKSAEGFLFPATYSLDPGTTAEDALQQLTSQFTGVDRDMGFADAAHKMKITPYQALTVASMIEGEAKFDADRAKVAQVIYNRLAAHMPLGIDATSVYGAKLAGQDPSKIDYNKPAPYNTRLEKGLPPTPIGNPGRAALAAAIAPTPGNWLYYVNGDADGHLYFTNSPSDFQAAVEKCRQNHWGCT
jgi:peptidoglycan lytic transglycosylase G